MSSPPTHPPEPLPPELQDPEGAARLERRARRREARQAFGTKLLYTFAITLTLVTTLVLVAAGFLLRDAAFDAMDSQLGGQLEAVAALTAEDVSGSIYLQEARTGLPEARQRASEQLAARLTRRREQAAVSAIVVFELQGDPPRPRLLASAAPARPGGTPGAAGELGRLLADQGAIERAVAGRRASSSTLYEYAAPGAEPVLYKGGYAPVLGPDGAVQAVVGVELPADFRAAVNELLTQFLFLATLAGASVLAAAVLLVRQRVHVPVYRLVRAMEGKDGQPLPAKIRWQDEIGELTNHYNHMVDRLAEKERELRELYARTRERAVYLQEYSDCLVAGVPSGVVAVDRAGVVTVWNPPAARILGREGRPGARLEEQLGPDHPLLRALRGALSGSPTSQAIVILDEAGEEQTGEALEEQQRLVELSAAPFRGEDGALLGAAALVNDRTELEQLRRSASRNERLAAIGSLGAGLAHEIKNPLGAISGFAELIERREGQDAARLAGRLRSEVERLDTFLREFLSFARDNKVRREPCDLAALVRQSVESALQAAGVPAADLPRALEGAEVTPPGAKGPLAVSMDLEEGLPALALDGTLLRSACTNVALNALQVMAAQTGGRLSVLLRRAGGAVYARFRDQGPGIPPEDRERVFDPLFTTRAEGTGLGLAIAHKAVVAHGGKITVREAPGGGAELTLRIPAVEVSTPAPVNV